MRRLARTVLIGGCALAVPTDNPSLAEIAYRPGPAISGAAIKKKVDAQWFHVNESCVLRAKGKDTDQKCESTNSNGWVPIEDYINLPATSWSGEGIAQGSTGAEVTWDMAVPTGDGGVTVTATIRDHATSPAATADDGYDATATKQMYAYEAVAVLNCTSSHSGSVSSTVHESASYGERRMLSLARDQIGVYAAQGDTVHTGSKELDAFGTATWILKTNPSTATLGTNGQLKTRIAVETMAGRLLGSVYDSDLVDGPVSVAVGLSGGQGVSAGVEVNIEIGEDSDEGCSGAGFAFSSDHLGDDTDSELEMKSSPYYESELPARDSEDFSVVQSATFRGSINSESKAKAIVEAKVERKGSAYATATTEGFVLYDVGVPTYEPGQAPASEPGY